MKETSYTCTQEREIRAYFCGVRKNSLLSPLIGFNDPFIYSAITDGESETGPTTTAWHARVDFIHRLILVMALIVGFSLSQSQSKIIRLPCCSWPLTFVPLVHPSQRERRCPSHPPSKVLLTVPIHHSLIILRVIVATRYHLCEAQSTDFRCTPCRSWNVQSLSQ